MPSSVISMINYNPASTTLQVIFLSGAVYNYTNVPEAVYKAMQKAKSKGSYLNNYIKGRYSFKKIE